MEKQTTYGNGTPQISHYERVDGFCFVQWDCRQYQHYRREPLADRPVKRPVKTIRHEDTEAIPDNPADNPERPDVRWTGEHPLNESILHLVERIDYATVDEDAAQDMLCSLLKRSHSVKNKTDFTGAVYFALKDARKRRAQMTPTGVNWESLPTDGGSTDRRKEQLPGAIRPYDGPEPPARETIPQSIVRDRVVDETALGAYRFNREFQTAAYCME